MAAPHQRFKELLLHNEAKIGVWGSGYIGLTSAINFAINGVQSICYDVNEQTVEAIRRGAIAIPNLEYWLGVPIQELVADGMVQATTRWEDLLAPHVIVHLIAVPTEREGEPWEGPLQDVIAKIASKRLTSGKPDLIIIESTLTPNQVEHIVVKLFEAQGHVVGRDVFIGVAPRRDWFHSPEMNLKNLPRVIGGTTPETTELLKSVLEIICDKLLPASSHMVAELVKSVENSLLHVPSVFAMELARAYPHVDVQEVLKLVSTHWRIPHYYPSMGTGGYCIPVSSKYVIMGATHPQELTIAKAAIWRDEEQKRFIAELVDRHTDGPIGILGITYKGDLKVHTLSPAVAIIQYLKARGRRIWAHDPYYTPEELNRITGGVEALEYPRHLSKLSAILLVPNHRLYIQTPRKILFEHLRPGQLIFDNLGCWRKMDAEFLKRGIRYHCIGDSGWTLEQPGRAEGPRGVSRLVGESAG